MVCLGEVGIAADDGPAKAGRRCVGEHEDLVVFTVVDGRKKVGLKCGGYDYSLHYSNFEF